MKKFILMTSMAIILSTVLAEESQADEIDCSGDECYVYRSSCGDNCEWSIDNGVLTIKNHDSGPATMYNVGYDPNAYGMFEDKETTFMMPWSKDEYRNLITSVVIDGVSNVGAYAFDYMPNIKSVTLGESVKTIGDSAFLNTNLESVDLSNVTYIEEGAFDSVPLKYIKLPDSPDAYIGNYAFIDTGLENCGNGGSCGTCDGF